MKTIEIKNLQAPKFEELSDSQASAVSGGASVTARVFYNPYNPDSLSFILKTPGGSNSNS